MNKFMFATMTEKELFERFLDAPLRAGPTSTLFEGKEVGETPGEILGEPIYDADCIPEDMGICMLDRLSESDDPAGDMEFAIDELCALVERLKIISREFNSLWDATQALMPDDAELDIIFNEAEKNSRSPDADDAAPFTKQKPNCKESLMTTETSTTDKPAATLTEKELFKRFLDAPFFKVSATSTLAGPRHISEETIGDYVADGFFEASSWPADVREFVFERLRECDDPSTELHWLKNDILGLQSDVEMLERGFEELAEATCINNEADAGERQYRLPTSKEGGK
ncbi:MAG: hypothetical protein QUV18_13700 [Roseovarius sp.]|nr:hypothetical protein [Roseovarius sp.]